MSKKEIRTLSRKTGISVRIITKNLELWRSYTGFRPRRKNS
jgi:hypothetical protein